MKAVIMAGGEGKRLKAVTGELPKPMVPLLGRPVMEHIILLLREYGFKDICVSAKYRAEDIMEYFGDGSSLGVKLQYRIEAEPLGTAGGVKNCEDFYGGEDFLVISGDAACDFDLGRFMRAHREHGCPVSIALCHNSEPVSYGLAITNRDNHVKCFIEKPDWPRVVTDMVNTGIYLISPRIMELVPKNTQFDFAKDLFPLLLERGEEMLALPMDGYWCDIGTPLSYYKCCVDALEGRLRLHEANGFGTVLENSLREQPSDDGDFHDLACRDRAALMRALSQSLMDAGADYSDGIRLSGRGYRAHISPLSHRSAIRIAVSSEDAEFAKELGISLRELAENFDL